MPTVCIADGVTDNSGTYGMINLSRPSTVTDYKAHISFIRQSANVFSIGYLQNSNTCGWVRSSNMNTSSGIFITDTSSVGIGTTAPSSRLHVYGAGASASYSSYQFSIGNSSSDRNIIFGTDNTSGSIQSTVNLTTTTPATAWLTLNPLGGFVGIGTNAPTSALQVVGTVTATTFLTTISSINTQAATNPRAIAATAPAIYLFSLTTTALTINGVSGDVYAKAIIYVSISSAGVVTQNVLVSVGIQITSYSGGFLYYSVGYGGNTVNNGGDSIVSLTRFL
jgi:hypothetical protein